MATFDTVILGEHEKIRTLWREVKEKNNAEAANSLITQICVHFGMEAMVVYPEIRKRVPDGDQLARKLLQQHLLIENRLAELQQQRQQLPTTEEDSQWAILEEVIPKLYEMMEDFENNVLPPLKRALSEERQRELASRLEQSRNKVPHRPHRHMAREQLNAKLANAMAAPADRMPHVLLPPPPPKAADVGHPSSPSTS
ncbi:Hemerythrin domain-containing protein [Balamuthia mandrillaris]